MSDQFQARPTVYKGIQMRSRMEAGYAAWLDKFEMKWEYEPCAFGYEAGQYLPDFRIQSVPLLGRGDRNVYIECKPWTFFVDDPKRELELFRRMWSITESDPDALLLIEVCGGGPRREGANTCRLGRIHDRDEYVVLPLTWCRIPTSGGRVTLGLADPLDESHGPWFGEWWRG